MRPRFSFTALTDLLTLHVNGVVYMGFSRDWDDRFSDDSHVLEVRCDKRRLSKGDLSLTLAISSSLRLRLHRDRGNAC